MKKVFHFLGSIHFTLFLLAVTTLFVVIGTVVEAKTDSHRFAEQISFSSPLFKSLLFFFFVNILLSTLRRYPFRRGHIPFIMTHIGLLMLLGGVMVKSFFGLQGHMILLEGSGSDEVILPGSLAIEVQKKTELGIERAQLCLGSGAAPFPELQVIPIELYPHGREHFASWIQGEHLRLAGLAPLPLDSCLEKRIFSDSDKLCSLYALRTDHLKSTLDELRSKQGAILAFIQEPSGSVYLFFQDEWGRETMEEFPPHELRGILEYEEGFKGYAAFAKVAFLKDYSLIDPLPPPLLYFKEQANQAGVPFEKTLFAFLQGELTPCLERLLSRIPTEEARETIEEKGRLLALYFRLFSLNLETVFSKEVKQEITLFSPLVRTCKALPPLQKLEENTPLLKVAFLQGNTKEVIDLPLAKNTGLFWPVLKGQYLVRFQHAREKIPYRIRLRQARKICYPGTDQALSYECDVLATHQNGTVVEKTLSMNHVLELSGYRFYLSSIAPGNAGKVQRVQIVVNKDPAKYTLTYPGAACLLCGAILLFLPSFRRKE